MHIHAHLFHLFYKNLFRIRVNTMLTFLSLESIYRYSPIIVIGNEISTCRSHCMNGTIHMKNQSRADIEVYHLRLIKEKGLCIHLGNCGENSTKRWHGVVIPKASLVKRSSTWVSVISVFRRRGITEIDDDAICGGPH